MTDPMTETFPLSGASFTDTFVEADGFRIRYRDAGEGAPLICLHGGGGLRLSRMHELLAKSNRLIAFEVPGFGESPRNNRSASMEDLARSMNEAVSALGIAPYTLMGTSFGAKLALWMAILRPEDVNSIVLISPAAIRLDDRRPPSHATPSEAAAMLYAHPERVPHSEPLPPEIGEQQRDLSSRLLGPPRDEAFEARLGALHMPVLTLFGTADRVTPAKAAVLYRRALPNCHIVLVYDAAHAIDIDRPNATADLIEDFIKRGEQFLVRNTSSLIHQ